MTDKVRTTLNLDKETLSLAKRLAESRSTRSHKVSLSELVREAVFELLNKEQEVKP